RRQWVDPEVATILLFAITTVAVIVWLIGLLVLVGSYQWGRAGQIDDLAFMCDLPDSSPGNWQTGSAEVEGHPSVLAGRAASVMAKGHPFGLIKIVEKTEDHIIFERLGPSVMNQP